MAEGQETSREDRQLPATDKRLQQAREDGNVPRSRDLAHFAVIGTALAGLSLAGPWAGERLVHIMQAGLRFERERAFEPTRALEWLATPATDALVLIVTAAVVVSVAAIAATLALGGFNVSWKAMTPDFARLDPMQGATRMFSRDGAVDLVKLLLQTTILLGTAAWFAAGRLPELVSLGAMPLAGGIGWAWSMLHDGLALLLGLLALSALVDAPLQWFRYRANLRMTLEEVKEEGKQTEGNPEIKARLRQRQREMSRGRQLAAVPRADVVVTNPTHYAVALAYDESRMGAPRVVAKGADLFAARIREVAAEAGVPLLEAPPLARALYTHAEVDQEIPAALYTAVAQVLAWVFQLRQPVRGRAPSAPSAIEVPPGLDPLDERSAQA